MRPEDNPADEREPTQEEWEARPDFAEMTQEEKDRIVEKAMHGLALRMPRHAYPVFLLVAQGGSSESHYCHLPKLLPGLIVSLENALDALKREYAAKHYPPERN